MPTPKPPVRLGGNMIIRLRDLVKLFGISIVSFCAVFVCTFFLNFYWDVVNLPNIPADLQPLYHAQLAMAQFTAGISGGFLAVIAVIMLLFYVRLYINQHTRQLGILKAMGYSDVQIARQFWVFGGSVLLGTALGYACGHLIMPYIYRNLLINGLPQVTITFHPTLLLGLVVLPTMLYAGLACLFAWLALRRPVGDLLRGGNTNRKIKPDRHPQERPFLREMQIKCVNTNRALTFFVAFGVFCFAAMVQMAFAMQQLDTGSMALIILIIGLVLAGVSLLMAITSLINANTENLTLMRAFGYNLAECLWAVFGGFIPWVLVGFAVGTVYQYGLLSLMVNLIFADVAGMASYTFDLPLMLATLVALVIALTAIVGVYAYRIQHTSLKQAFDE